MKQIRRNARRALFCLCLLFVLLILYGVYYVSISSSRLFSTDINSYAAEQMKNVLPGDLMDRNGVVMATTMETIAQDGAGGSQKTYTRVYQPDARARAAAVHITGDRKGEVKYSMNRMMRAYLYGFYMPIWERLGSAFSASARTGDNVTLTVDSRLITYAASLFPEGKAGAIVVMNYKTGEVLTEQSFPNFDPEEGILTNQSAHPEINRAIGGLNAPGSTFKIITAASAIENLSDYATRSFHCEGLIELNGHKITDAGTDLAAGNITRHGQVTLLRAFQVSCNNTFATVGLTLGDEKLKKTAQEFGFDDNFLFRDLIVENSVYPAESRTEDQIAWTGVGQSALQTSPLHMCMAAAAVANDGVMMEPRMLLKAVSQTGAQRIGFTSKVYRRALSESNAAVLKEYMRAVITGGTGTAAAVNGKRVCGKTGTAEKTVEKTVNGVRQSVNTVNAWFVGFLDEPDCPYALAVVVEDAEKGGGAVSAPIAKQLFQWLLSNGYSQ